jgi:U3 small nucleolar ribonucleoprotein protein IMP4
MVKNWETSCVLWHAGLLICLGVEMTRHHVYEKPGGVKSIDLKEVGPRFELRLYQIKLGTVDQVEAQNEWVMRPYMNTARKRTKL